MEEPYDYVEHEPQTVQKRNHVIFKIAFVGQKVYVKLKDSVQKDTLTFVSMTIETHFKKDFHVIKATYSTTTQKGYLKYVFSILLFDFGFTIMSDSMHTIPGSMNFWKSIKNLKNTECRFINLYSRYNRAYTNQHDTVIWGVDMEYFSDGVINGFAIDELYRRRVICINLYNFIKENEKTINNCEGMRLYTARKISFD